MNNDMIKIIAVVIGVLVVAFGASYFFGVEDKSPLVTVTPEAQHATDMSGQSN